MPTRTTSLRTLRRNRRPARDEVAGESGVNARYLSEPPLATATNSATASASAPW
jgi:hypothetical protein